MILLASESIAGDEADSGQVEPAERSDAEPASPEPEPPTDLPLDQVFEILKNQRRRYVLQYLKERGEPVSMSELSEQIAAWENDKTVAQLSSGERKRVYVGLYQCHLPKMDGMDVVAFNKPRGIIELGENAHVFDPYLEREEDEEPAWHRYYGALAAASAVALLVAGLLEAAVGPMPAVELAAVLAVGGFSVCSGLHVRWARRQADEDDGGQAGGVETAATA